MKNNTLLSPPLSYGAVSSTGNVKIPQQTIKTATVMSRTKFRRRLQSFWRKLTAVIISTMMMMMILHPDHLSHRLLTRAQSFSLPHDTDRGFRGNTLKLSSFKRPHMRAFHGSWICYFISLFLQFAMCPLLPEIASSLNLTKSDVWLTNIYSMIGGIPMGLLLGPLCDQYGARILITLLLIGGAIPCLCTGLVTNLHG